MKHYCMSKACLSKDTVVVQLILTKRLLKKLILGERYKDVAYGILYTVLHIFVPGTEGDTFGSWLSIIFFNIKDEFRSHSHFSTSEKFL